MLLLYLRIRISSEFDGENYPLSAFFFEDGVTDRAHEGH